jgi:hypothetical protein
MNAYGGVSLIPNSNEIRFKMEIEQITKKNGNFVLSAELIENNSVIFLGYRNPSFNISFPVLIIDSFLPVLGAGILLFLGYWLKK